MSSPLPSQPEEEYGNPNLPEKLDDIQENTDSMEEKLQEIENDTI